MPGLLTKPKKVPPPSDDKRWKLVDRAMRIAGYDRHALIETLHAVQESFGYIGDDAMRYVAQSLRVPLSTVYGVASFYHFFTLKPAGKHACVVCLGTACYIKGAPALVDAVSERFHVGVGETSQDGRISLLAARCVGACGMAPVAVVDGQTVSKATPEQLVNHLAGLDE
jgi:bidirectional [NiFe] hydrogenase diaphorase subunit